MVLSKATHRVATHRAKMQRERARPDRCEDWAPILYAASGVLLSVPSLPPAGKTLGQNARGGRFPTCPGYFGTGGVECECRLY